MIKADKRCVGCGACYKSCSVGAISFEIDEDGFYYPEVDLDKCISCGKCQNVCPLEKGLKKNAFERKYYAACLRDVNKLANVSSGGVFLAIATKVIEDGGVVYGAVELGVGNVRHRRATSLEEVQKMCKSKYFPSLLLDVYDNIVEDIKNKKTILFSGLPCQVAAVLAYAGDDYDNLITCEIVCHGMPSKSIYLSYIKEEQKQNNGQIVRIDCRDKGIAWRKNQYAEYYEDGRVIRKLSNKHPFHRPYIDGLICRVNCEKCVYQRNPRIADITLGDYWKYSGELIDKSCGSGVSLVVCSSERGEALLKVAEENLFIEKSYKELAEMSCYHLTHAPFSNVFRRRFLSIARKKGITAANKIYTKPEVYIFSIANRLKKRIFRLR